MKRVRPAASIQEWVACSVAVAVKKATESKKIAALEWELNRVRKQLADCGKEKNDLEKELRRYEAEFLQDLPEAESCNKCGHYWSREYLFDCEGGCEERKCERCVTIKECAQCGQYMCSDCFVFCETAFCFARICYTCSDKNTDCAHRMCNDHSSPCTKCPVFSFANSSSSNSSSEE